jgi:hypothetical protein
LWGGKSQLALSSCCYGHGVKKKQKEVILTKVQIATTEVSESVDDLDKLLSARKAAPRAEKTTISKIVEEAFLRLKNARVALIDVEALVKKEKAEE